MVPNQLLAITYQITGPGVIPAGDGTAQLDKIVSQVIGVMTIIAVLYFVFIVIIGGYNFIAAQGDEKMIEQARKQLTNGVLGLVIVIIALGLGSLVAALFGINNALDFNAMLHSMGL